MYISGHQNSPGFHTRWRTPRHQVPLCLCSRQECYVKVQRLDYHRAKPPYPGAALNEGGQSEGLAITDAFTGDKGEPAGARVGALIRSGTVSTRGCGSRSGSSCSRHCGGRRATFTPWPAWCPRQVSGRSCRCLPQGGSSDELCGDTIACCPAAHQVLCPSSS
jgi:hypothetical protein